MNKISSFIEYTNLKPYATKKDIIRLCKQAIKYNFYAVCVNPFYVKLCKKILEGTPVKVCSVVGFPLGATTTATKVFEAKQAIKDGADEIDVVVNLSALKSNDFKSVYKEIKTLREVTKNKVLKLIIETCYLTKEEKIKICNIAKKAKVDFIKTSTGFGKSGAKESDVRLIKSIVGEKIGIKASGGIKNKKTALKMIKLGATRIGTSSLIKD